MIEQIKLYFQDLYGKWETLVWLAGDENREMVRERLRQHDEAMANGELGPYFSQEN